MCVFSALITAAFVSMAPAAMAKSECGQAEILSSEINEALKVCTLPAAVFTSPKLIALIRMANNCPTDWNVTGPVGQARFRELVAVHGAAAACSAFISGLR